MNGNGSERKSINLMRKLKLDQFSCIIFRKHVKTSWNIPMSDDLQGN